MPSDRVRVCAIFDGSPAYYQREQEQKRNGRWVAWPLFVHNPREAVSMTETFARHFVTQLQGKGIRGLWLEDCRTNRRIEIESAPPQQIVEDNRSTCTATLDDQYSPDAQWFFVHPINRPDGAGQWFLRCTPPGFPTAQIIYTRHPLDCLQRAKDLNLLQYGERAPAPEPQQPAPAAQSSNTWRRRPGDAR